MNKADSRRTEPGNNKDNKSNAENPSSKGAFMKAGINVSGSTTAALIYLWVPVILFFAFWLKPWIGLPLIAVFLYVCLKLIRTSNRNGCEAGKYAAAEQAGIFASGNRMWLLAILAVLFLWCILSGQGGFVNQAYDWWKHNAILRDLINMDWPVRYEGEPGSGVLSYYIGSYLIPGAAGKLLGWDGARMVMLLQTYLGVVITYFLMCRIAGADTGMKLVLTALVLVLFSTFIVPLKPIYNKLCPWDANESLHWISAAKSIQYSSNIVQLRWVFAQSVPAWIATALLYKERNRKELWGLIIIPVIFCSTFAFIGLLCMALALFLFDLIVSKARGELMKSCFSAANIISVIMGAVLALYILGNVLQPKPFDAGMSLYRLNYEGFEWLFFFFQLSWMLWVILLIRRQYRNIFIYIASVILFILPIYHFGAANDLCMRASIPALFTLSLLLCEVLCTAGKAYKAILLSLLLIAASGGIYELYNEAFSRGMGYDKSAAPYSGMEDMMEKENTDSIIYQYIDWASDEDINSLLLR